MDGRVHVGVCSMEYPRQLRRYRYYGSSLTVMTLAVCSDDTQIQALWARPRRIRAAFSPYNLLTIRVKTLAESIFHTSVTAESTAHAESSNLTAWHIPGAVCLRVGENVAICSIWHKTRLICGDDLTDENGEQGGSDCCTYSWHRGSACDGRLGVAGFTTRICSRPGNATKAEQFSLFPRDNWVT